MDEKNTIFNDIELEMSNRMIELFKFNNFYALPRSHKTPTMSLNGEIEYLLSQDNISFNVYNYEIISKLPRARCWFGTYEDNLYDDITKLQPCDNLKETKKYKYGMLKFDFHSTELDESTIYIDNIIIFTINTLTNRCNILTVKDFEPILVKEDGEKIYKNININYRINFSPFNGKFGIE